MSKVFEGHGFVLEYNGQAEFESVIGWKTSGSAGFDLCWTGEKQNINGLPNIKTAQTGVRILKCEPSLVGVLAIRSSLAAAGYSLQNGVGIIDSDYRDEICVLIRNQSHTTRGIKPGDRIAQLLFIPFHGAVTRPQDARIGGLGSTGQ